jgi:hypothetical protein
LKGFAAANGTGHAHTGSRKTDTFNGKIMDFAALMEGSPP